MEKFFQQKRSIIPRNNNFSICLFQKELESNSSPKYIVQGLPNSDCFTIRILAAKTSNIRLHRLCWRRSIVVLFRRPKRRNLADFVSERELELKAKAARLAEQARRKAKEGKAAPNKASVQAMAQRPPPFAPDSQLLSLVRALVSWEVLLCMYPVTHITFFVPRVLHIRMQIYKVLCI